MYVHNNIKVLFNNLSTVYLIINKIKRSRFSKIVNRAKRSQRKSMSMRSGVVIVVHCS
jgi:hypothetical protein